MVGIFIKYNRNGDMMSGLRFTHHLLRPKLGKTLLRITIATLDLIRMIVDFNLIPENLSVEAQALLSRDLSFQVLLDLFLWRTIDLLSIELLHHLFLIVKHLIVSRDRHILNL